MFASGVEGDATAVLSDALAVDAPEILARL